MGKNTMVFGRVIPRDGWNVKPIALRKYIILLVSGVGINVPASVVMASMVYTVNNTPRNMR